jgi:hypothetical protein
MKDFEIGDEVEVTAGPGDDFANDFTGTVYGFRGEYIQVKDQDDDVWECEAGQLKLVED